MPVLQLQGITKRFGNLVANDDITLSLQRGEVLALLGENGAGKSTLVSILFGHYRADAGQILVDGQPLPPGQPKAAIAAGIGMVHQHFTLADNLSVLDNVVLGTESLWQPWSARAGARAALQDTARRYGLQVDADARVGQLSVGERQRVEILKALVPLGRRRGARILILDEPTAVLTPQESESLFATLQQLVAQGLAVIFISHRLDEVLRVSHRVAVLRAGRLVAQMAVAGAAQPPSKADLAEAMVGREVVRTTRAELGAELVTATPSDGAPDANAGVTIDVIAKATGQPAARPVMCALHGVAVRGTGARPQLDRIDLQLHAGEVVAIAGVAGNGQHALADLLHGLLAPDAGQLRIAGQVLPASPRAWVQAGVARIPEDRHAAGVVGDLPVWENAVLEHYAHPAFAHTGWRRGWIKRRAAQAHAQALIERFDVRGTQHGGLGTLTRALSGGNMQKLILGRALTPVGAAGAPGAAPDARAPVLIVANQPTWGLDVGAVAYVHQQLLQACQQGAALLLISEDLDEVFALADRIAVMHHGRLTEARPRRQWTLADIGLAMAGSGDAAKPALMPAGAQHAA